MKSIKEFVKNIRSNFKFTKTDFYFGILIIIVAYYMHGINTSLSGFYKIDYPMDENNHFYYKKLYDGNKLLILIKKDKIKYVVYYRLLDKYNKVIDKGSMPIDMNEICSFIGITYNKDKNITFPVHSYKDKIIVEPDERKRWKMLQEKLEKWSIN